MDHELINEFFEFYRSCKTARTRQQLLSIANDLLTLDERVVLLDKCIAFINAEEPPES